MSMLSKMAIPENTTLLCVNLGENGESHLFRHASEITRETKGGYLQGQIIVPRAGPSVARFIRISLTPAEIEPDSNPLHIHPNLLHVNMRQNKKARNLVEGQLPDDVDWSFIFRIDPDGTVSRVMSTNPSKRFQYRNKLPQDLSDSVLTKEAELKNTMKDQLNAKGIRDFSQGNLVLPEYSTLVLQRVTSLKNGEYGQYIELGNTGLMLNIITPLQKFSKGGITLCDVLKQRFEDLFNLEMSSDMLKQLEEVYTGRKEDKIKLQQVRLMVELFSCDPEPSFVKSCQSEIITNSKSKECGPLQLHDINPAASCTKGATKVFILSVFKLVSEVKAAFVLYDVDKDDLADSKIHERLTKQINQPDPAKCTVFNQNVLIFIAPPQDFEVIQEIHRRRLELRVCAFRPSDGRMSKNLFSFTYIPHIKPMKPKRELDEQPEPGMADMLGLRHRCPMCLIQDFNSGGQVLPLAKPGVQRRKDEKKYLPYGTASKLNKSAPVSPESVDVSKAEVLDVKLDPVDLSSPTRKRKSPQPLEALSTDSNATVMTASKGASFAATSTFHSGLPGMSAALSMSASAGLVELPARPPKKRMLLQPPSANNHLPIPPPPLPPLEPLIKPLRRQSYQ